MDISELTIDTEILYEHYVDVEHEGDTVKINKIVRATVLDGEHVSHDTVYPDRLIVNKTVNGSFLTYHVSLGDICLCKARHMIDISMDDDVISLIIGQLNLSDIFDMVRGCRIGASIARRRIR